MVLFRPLYSTYAINNEALFIFPILLLLRVVFIFVLLYLYVIFVPAFFPHPEEFLQTVQSTAGMAVVLLIRSIMVNGDDVPVIVSEHSFFPGARVQHCILYYHYLIISICTIIIPT